MLIFINNELLIAISDMMDQKLDTRLNTIESCYTGTYTRYKNYADKIQPAFDDIDLLNKVVSGHSKKLEQLV